MIPTPTQQESHYLLTAVDIEGWEGEGEERPRATTNPPDQKKQKTKKKEKGKESGGLGRKSSPDSDSDSGYKSMGLPWNPRPPHSVPRSVTPAGGGTRHAIVRLFRPGSSFL
jgi:hypothetical protein